MMLNMNVIGKTVQVCVHFGIIATEVANEWKQIQDVNNTSGMGNECPIFLIVCPVTVLPHWVSEWHKWVPFMRILTMHTVVSPSFASVLKLCGGKKGRWSVDGCLLAHIY